MKTAIGILLNFYLIALLGITLAISHNPMEKLPLTAEKRYGSIPDFSSFTNVKEKKQRFFNYFAPIVADENQRILQHRETLKPLHKKLLRNRQLSMNEIRLVDEYATNYRVKTQTDKVQQIIQILDRANAVPISLALAQAANESAWGTSRFATQGNNFFGQWCFNKGCGLVPRQRGAHSSHEVRVFNNAAESVRAYIRNINTHAAYEDLRQLRAQAEKESMFASGSLLAEGLLSYSERGHAYVDEIQSMIEINQLESLDPSGQIGTR